MAAVAAKEGAEIRLSSPVRRIQLSGRTATGVELQSGERIEADAVVINADFGHAMTHLFDPGVIRKYTAEKLRRKKYSCSTFMLYLGVDKKYDEPHHHIVFARDYRANIGDIVTGTSLSDDMSVYVRDASATDPSLAPAGHSALYVLVPAPNTRGSIDWTPELTTQYRDKVIDKIVARTSMKDLRSHIVAERVITPAEWEGPYGLFQGATFNLGHSIDQMLYFRPRNRFEEIRRCYLVGGGTHPGSGLPTIYESARISANLIGKDIG
jgi:phytoene desaturase